mgnify:CR=1 FL=1
MIILHGEIGLLMTSMARGCFFSSIVDEKGAKIWMFIGSDYCVCGLIVSGG